MPIGGSQGGQIVFLADNCNHCCVVYWNSSQIKHVPRSTVGAETLSLSDGCGIVILIHSFIKEFIESIEDIKVVYTDNFGVPEPSPHAGWVLEKGLIVDVSSIREMID